MNNTQPPPPMTWEERLRVGAFLAQFPTLTVLVFLRRGIGYRNLPVGRILVMGFILYALGNPFGPGAFPPTTALADWVRSLPGFPTAPPPVVFPDMTNPSSPVDPLTGEPLRVSGMEDRMDVRPSLPVVDSPPSSARGYLGLFGIAFVVLAAKQRAARWKEYHLGIARHSYDRGQSVFSFLPLPPATIERHVDPLVCIIVGFFTMGTISGALGLWLVLSGFSLRLVEFMVHRQQIAQHFDAIDAAIDSSGLSDVVQSFGSPGHAQGGHFETTILRATLARDVEELIARRQRQVRSNVPPVPGQWRRPFWQLVWGKRLYGWWESRQCAKAEISVKNEQ
jgi:hypothetical protein